MSGSSEWETAHPALDRGTVVTFVADPKKSGVVTGSVLKKPDDEFHWRYGVAIPGNTFDVSAWDYELEEAQ